MVARSVTTDARPAGLWVVTDVGRGVDLPPEAWHLAPWRNAPPLPRPAAALMAAAERDAVHADVRPRLRPDARPKQYNDPSPVAYHVAAMLGLHDEVWEPVRGWRVGPTDPARHVLMYHAPLLILLGLRDPAAAEAKARELGVPLNSRFDFRAWLALTGVAGAGYAAEQLGRHRSGNKALFDELARVKDPAAARHVLALRVRGRTPDRARAWLEENVGSAVAGLLPLTPGRDKVSVAAVEYRRDAVKHDYGWVVEREVATADLQVAGKVRRAVLDRPERIVPEFEPGAEPDWLRRQLVGRAGRNIVPAWAGPATLPPVLVGGFRLSAAHVAALIAELRHVAANRDDESEAAAPVADAFRAHASVASLDAFATELFERWVAEKTPHADSWVLEAVGRLGGNAAVDALVPRLRRWPGGTSSRRIKDALAAIRAIGTDYALARLANLAAGHPNHRSRGFAAEELAAAAADRGQTLEQLEDRTVPDLGLSGGGLVFSYGPRQFRLALGAGLTVVARDDRGKPHAALPPPRKTDDARLVAEAREAFRLARTRAGEVLSAVCDRLERGLVHQRRWPADDFDRFLVRHPITGAVACRLVWGWFGVDGSLTGTFRVTDEGESAGPDDRPAVANAIQVGLVHPVQLSAAERAAWAERLADYELVPPFPQLARPVFDLPDGDREVTEVLRFAAKSVPWAAIQRTVRDRGWVQHGERHSRAFPAAGLSAVAVMSGWERREVKGCVFVPGTDPNPAYDPRTGVPLGQVPAVVRCEVFADLAAWARAAGAPG